jgi:ABC-2 type transport system permease protein
LLFFELAGIFANVLVFFFIAKLVGEDVPQVKAYTGGYFPFVLVGIALANYQSVSLNCFAAVIHREQDTGTLEALLITPTSLSVILLSSSLWPFLWATIRVLFYFFIGIFLFKLDFSQINIAGTLASILLMITSLSGLGLISTGFALVYKRGDPVGFLINSFSRFFAGVYFPITILPAWIQSFSCFFPLTYALEALRRSILNGEGLYEIRQQLIILFIFSVVFLTAGCLFLKAAHRRAMKEGSLAFH